MNFQANLLKQLAAVKRLLEPYEEGGAPKILSAPISEGSCEKCEAPLYKVMIRATDRGGVAREPAPCLIAIATEPFKIRTDGTSVSRRLNIATETLAESLGIAAILSQFELAAVCGLGAYCPQCEELELRCSLQPPARGHLFGTQGEPQTRFVKQVSLGGLTKTTHEVFFRGDWRS